MSGEAEKAKLQGVSHWEVLGEKTLVKCRVFDLIERKFRHPQRDVEGDFYVLDTNDWVNVIALTPKKEIILVNQFRFGVEKTSWEIPGGVMDPGEDPIEAGLRELREETGYTPKRHRKLGDVSANPAIMNNTCHFVLAEDCELTSELEWDPHEELELRLVEIDEVYAMANRGEIFHSLNLNALLLFYPEWLKIQNRRRD
ncbi:MAG: NUDIX hydrolase [Verrucomicrobiota bacterium]